MMSKPRYTVERYAHGWTISGERGLPMDALGECLPLVGKKGVLAPGIAHHLKQCGHPRTVFAIGMPREMAKWCKEIEASLAHLDPETRWWKGTDVGLSSAAIFGEFASINGGRLQAIEYCQGASPADAADFGRCKRLLERFPTWRHELFRVADAYPDGDWPRLVAMWAQLEAVTDPQQLSAMIRGEAPI